MGDHPGPPGRARLRGRRAGAVDLADVRDEFGLVATGLAEEVRQATEQLVVRERRQRVSAFHDDNIGGRFAIRGMRVTRPIHGRRAKRAGAVATLVGSLRGVHRRFAPVSDGSRKGA